MSLPALLLFFFAPVLSALVRVRVGAVLPALIVAASLSVGATARAEELETRAPILDDGEWAVECQDDEWTDARKCIAYSWEVNRWGLGKAVALVFHCSKGDDGKVKGGVFLGSRPDMMRYHAIFPDTKFSAYSTVLEPPAETVFDTQGGSRHALRKVPIRRDKEPPSEAVFFLPPSHPNLRVWTWAWDWAWDERASGPNQAWERIEYDGIPELLREKKQLRIRWKDGDEPVVLTFSLGNDAAGATSSAASACSRGG